MYYLISRSLALVDEILINDAASLTF